MWRRRLGFLIFAGCSFEHGTPGFPSDAAPALDAPTDARIEGTGDDGATPDAPVDSPPDGGGQAMCPASYNLHDPARPGSYYRMVTASAPWPMAEALCELDGSTSHLIVLDDQAERAWAYAQSSSDQWAGITDIVFEDTWLPVTDQASWYAGNATGNVPPKDCLVITQSDTAADMCGNGHPYLCECDGYGAVASQF